MKVKITLHRVLALVAMAGLCLWFFVSWRYAYAHDFSFKLGSESWYFFGIVVSLFCAYLCGWYVMVKYGYYILNFNPSLTLRFKRKAKISEVVVRERE